MTVTNMEETWPDQQKYNKKDKHNDKYIQRTPSESAPRDLWPLRLFYQSDEETWPDQQKDNNKDKDNDNDNDKDNDKDI